MTIDLFDLVCALMAGSAALSNYQLRRKLRTKKKQEELPAQPVNVLEDGVVMPVPDDPRWEAAEDSIDDDVWEEKRKRWRKVRRMEAGYRLGGVWVTMNAQVFAGDHEVGPTKRTRAYGRAVRTAYVNRHAQKAIEG